MSFHSRLNITKFTISEAVLIALTPISMLRYDTHISQETTFSLAILPYIYQYDCDLTSRKVCNFSNVDRVDVKRGNDIDFK